MDYFVIVREGILNEDGSFDECFQALQFPQPNEPAQWELWSQICTGYLENPDWVHNKNWLHENCVRRFWNRDMPSITVEISVKDIERGL